MVSVVVRTKNEEKHIGYCIQSLTDFIGKPEIVIVDNESTDNTIPIINRFEYHNIKKITIPKNDYTPGKSLNLGLKNCTEGRYMWSNFGDEPQTNYWCESEDRYFFHNAFSMFRTSYLKKYPFDEHYSGKEDRYWANKQIENGFEILYDSEQEVKHHYTPGGATWMGTG